MKPYLLAKFNEHGQSMLEYGMIIVLIAAFVMVVLLILGPGIGNLFSNVVDNAQ
jgi:Flp pilus assembly pilin Flp